MAVSLLPQLLLAHAIAARPSDAVRAASVDLGSVRVRLDDTTLAAVRGVFGGTPVAGGDAGASWKALCYRLTRDDAAVWLIATELGGGTRITMLAVEVGPMWPGCAVPRSAILFDPQPLPGIGSTAAELARYYGAHGDAARLVAFQREAHVARGGVRVERAEYRLRDGYADRVVFSRITAY